MLFPRAIYFQKTLSFVALLAYKSCLFCEIFLSHFFQSKQCVEIPRNYKHGGCLIMFKYILICPCNRFQNYYLVSNAFFAYWKKNNCLVTKLTIYLINSIKFVIAFKWWSLIRKILIVSIQNYYDFLIILLT